MPRLLFCFAVINSLSVASAQPVSTSQPALATTLPAGWEEIDQRLVFFTTQLASVETSLDAVNKALKTAGYQQSVKQTDAQRQQRGNELMDRNAGGPVRWQDFYGTTARQFYHTSGAGAIVASGPNYSLVAVAAERKPTQRPPQFDYIYRANEDAEKRAAADVAKLGGKIDALVKRREQLEAEQAAIWAKIAFQAVASRKIAAKPIFRFELKSDASDEAASQRQQAARASAAFVRSALRAVSDAGDVVDVDAAGTFDALHQVVATAAAELNDRLIHSPKLALEVNDSTKPLGRVVASAERLASVTKNASESYRSAFDGGRAGDEQRKQTFRAYTQQALFDCATSLSATADYVVVLGQEWKIDIDVQRPVSTTMPSAVAAVSKPKSAEVSPQRRVIDLLPLVNIKEGAAWGEWSYSNGTLKSDSARCARIEFPYQPPAEYDYKVEFTRASGNDCVNLICYAGDRQFGWSMAGTGNRISRFSVDRSDNPTDVTSKNSLENGRKYTCVVKVRRDGVQAFLDGELMTRWKTDFTDMKLGKDASLPHRNTVGLLTYESPTAFYSAEIIEISGEGKLLSRKDGQSH